VILGLDIAPARTDRVAEVRRAIYVAATRARSHLSVVDDPHVADAYGFEQLAPAVRHDVDGR
jgi:ATP-dependent exoDNAse (exonuclease V) beta subunit